MSKENLLPCPFCGGEAHFDHDDNGWNWIECGQCHASTNAAVSAMEDCKPGLAEAWNRRASLPSPDYQRGQENEAVRAALKPWLAHKSDCDSIYGRPYACTCGLDAAIRALPAQQESVCEWKPSESGSARYQTGCGKSVISTGQEDGDECCCCSRPIRLGGGE